MPTAGYYRYPTIAGDTVVFVSEDDLWTVSAQGGVARRLTSGLGMASFPALSPDGKFIAFSGRDEGHTEVYLMPAEGGQPKRLTFLGSISLVVGWSPDGKIIFASNAAQPFLNIYLLYALSPQDGSPGLLPTGPALSISFGPKGGRVIGRNAIDPARWKRYRGGTAGDIWIDPDGSGNWRRLVQVQGNLSRPMWIGDRIFFLSDHEGIGNLYSCTPSGQDIQRHTDHEDFYVRHPHTDGRRIVYHAGADLYVYDTITDKNWKIEVEYHSPRTQRYRKFVESAKYLEDYALHPKGHLLAVTTRGKVFTMGNWEGPTVQHGEPDGVRHRLARWLHDGKRLVAVCDAEGEETLEIFYADGLTPSERLTGVEFGRAIELKASPKSEHVALTNHRNELILIDLARKTTKVLDKSPYAPIAGFDWSSDGRWIAYSCALSLHTSAIKVCKVETGEIFSVTRPVLQDVSPTFDPDGKYLYFLSYREFDPVYDNLHFDLGFPRGVRPYLVTLKKDLLNPFVPVPKAPEEKNQKPDEKEQKPEKSEEKIEIDFDGIEDRILAFPVPDGRYQQIAAMKGKVLYTSLPIEGSLNMNWFQLTEPPAKATLEVYDFESLKAEPLITGITNFKLSDDRKTLVYRAGNRLRVLKAGEKPDEKLAAEPPSKKSGWIDLTRVRVSVDPPAEWRQMFREAWRLQRDHFWIEDMADVDWHAVYERYFPLIDRISTRAEFSDLMWEMQGELGTSHAYEFGGDYRPEPRYDMGFLGADLAYDKKLKLWKIAHIVHGDPWDITKSSPLTQPGVNVREGDTILAINGRRVDEQTSPYELLVNQANCEILLTVGDAKGENSRTVSVKTLIAETPARYREWVEKKRKFVHEQTNGRVGYVHIPNMGPIGYSEFHRYFLSEIDREGLIIDVRFNGGGHVSELILEKLARRRIAYVKSRWFGEQPYPTDSVGGPMVALTNEYAGSDGDIFSHNFKLLKLGPLVGKRTWGGVIGIWARHSLVDGGITTQPEFSFWFKDVGWTVENYGTDPDIEVEHRPQDYVAGRDPQLERTVQEVLRLLETNPPSKPEFSKRPSRSLPRLPKR
ncbi:MAG: PDZ domain-containing protein [Candidatus Bipolaricaulota bacterium]|nr:PDZ domain-containing protein [Candidatus Bipolaricaulota bacterium]MDW8140748.1 PDZ domain-containing protein [Candidatus Bipolaricaulota bacterium]